MDSSPQIAAAQKPCFAARCSAELKRLALLAVVGRFVVAGKYYCFDRLDEEIRAHVENLLRTHYQGLTVSVRSARRVAGRGIEIRGIRIAEAGDGDGPVLAEIDEIFAECDTRLPDFLTRPPQITSLRVHRLKLRAERKATGIWNLSHLLPLPPSQSAEPPTAVITDAALEIVDPSQPAEGGACAWALRNMELTIQPDGEQPSDASQLPGTLLRIRGTLAGDHVERIELDGRLNPQTGDWQLRGAVEGLEFSPRLKSALPRELSAALAPLSSVRGRTYFSFNAEHNNAAQSQLQFVVHGRISEGRIDDARLPEPLTDVEAAIRCDNHKVVIESLSARCGGTQLVLKAESIGYDGRGPIDVELTARQLQLERLPMKALPPQVRETWNRFHPRGLTDISGRLRFDGQQWQPDLTIECHDLSFVYDRFPYRLTDGSGTILVKPDSVFVRLRTSGGGQTVTCRADVRQPGRYFNGWIEVQSEGPIPIDEKLLSAMDTPMQRVVRGFRPRGSASFYVRLERAPGESTLHRRVRVDLHECSIQHEKFAYPIDKVGGQLELTDNTWAFRNLTGRNDSAAIVGEGSWKDIEPDGRQLSLQFVATDLPLADELRQALPAGPQRLWTNLRPRGNIDHLTLGLKYGSLTRQWSVEVDAKKWEPKDNLPGRTISLEPAWFPYRLDNLTGRFHYDNGDMQLVNLHASHGKASVAAEGSCRVLPEGGCRLELTRLAADQVEVDQDFLAALPSGLKDSLGRFPLQGPVNLLGGIAIVTPPEQDAPLRIEWDMSLVMANGRLVTATPIEHLHGSLRLVGQHNGERLFSRGELKLDSAIIRGVQITNLEGPLVLDGPRVFFGSPAERDAHGRLPRQVTARIFGGLLSVDGELTLNADFPFGAQVTLENADLAQVTQQLSPQQRGLTGRVFGLARIGGNAQGMHTWRGNGQVRLRDADIYELPVMINLLKLLSIQRPDRTAFTTSNIDFRVEGDDLALERIDFNGDIISLKGTGRMNAQRELNLTFYPIFGREELHLPIFRPLLGETGREFMQIEVTGSLDSPEVRRRVLPRLDDQLQQLFPELARAEGEPAAAPIWPLSRDALERLRLMPRR